MFVALGLPALVCDRSKGKETCRKRRKAPIGATVRVPQRPLFWSIDGAWLFYVLTAIALGVCCYGLMVRLRLWRRVTAGRPV